MMLSFLSLIVALAGAVQDLPSMFLGDCLSASTGVTSLQETSELPNASYCGSDVHTCPGIECFGQNDYYRNISVDYGPGGHHECDAYTNASPPLSANQSNTPISNSASLQDCLAAKNVPISTNNSSSFAALAQPYNLRLAYTPAVIVLPTTIIHISDAIICAARHKVKVQAKSGGHSYASFSSGGRDGSMIIQLEEGFQGVTVFANGNAKIEAGVRLGKMALAIFEQGGRALPHGLCPGVGIGGHASHGGYGYSSRAWGLTLDTIVALEVVLANGSFINATSTTYPEVFWALRGAADSIGIITAFYLATQPAPAEVINWEYRIPDMFTSASTSAVVFQHVQAFALNASITNRNLGLNMYIDGHHFSIAGTYIGSLSTFLTKIAPPLLAGLPTPLPRSSVTSNNWIESLLKLVPANNTQELLTGFSLHENFFAKSVTTPESSPLSKATVEKYFNYIIQQGNPDDAPIPWFSLMNLYGGPDSQINIASPASSTYSHRSALWVAQHYGFTTDHNASAATTAVAGRSSPFPPSGMAFIEGLNAALMPSGGETRGFGAYLNYIDPSLSAAEAHELYYGAETYAKLMRIKKEVDPEGMFWNPLDVGN